LAPLIFTVVHILPDAGVKEAIMGWENTYSA
jgi:hypothetical protein